ncbi:MAG TPA: hypothetical protein VHZ54_18640 [Solirubrobacterales bacterium]|jgi:hypothetical protein|nr:hypothetical protein [Solirubrobacterales bacterium]
MQEIKDKRNVLVIVGREAEPPIMVDALRPRSEGTGFTLLVPATPLHGPDSPIDWADALDRAERGADAMRGAGLEVIETIVGDADFAAAAGDVMHSREIDDVVVLVDPQAAVGARPELVGV